jgi:hypothetical protein
VIVPLLLIVQLDIGERYRRGTIEWAVDQLDHSAGGWSSRAAALCCDDVIIHSERQHQFRRAI